MSNAAYDILREMTPKAEVDWTSTSIKATLVDDSYTYDTLHSSLADLAGSVVTGIADQDVVVSAVSDVGEVLADSVTFSGATAGQTVQAVVVYADLGGGDTRLLWFFDSGTGFPLATTGADVTVDWNASAGNGIVFRVA